MELSELRAEIDGIDRELVELFKKRMECAIMLAIAKEME